MGYTTDFFGGLEFNRELTHREWMELKRLGNYDSRQDGYYAEFTDTPDTIPDSYLQWEPNKDGTLLVWNGGEKFYDYVHWLRWLIKHYLIPHGLVVSGAIRWRGEDIDDVGLILAEDNKVTTKKLKPEGIVKCPNCGHRFTSEDGEK